MKSLRYVSDSSRGITRHRKGHGSKASFTYRNANGRPVTASATLARIRALAIPPAYEQVWICPHPNGHLQATGRDARGRKQYRYHPRWRTGKDEIKHARMHEFGRALPRLRRILQADLRRPGLPREKVLAVVVSLMDATCARIGNAEYARSNGSFGLSTLLDRHARFARNGIGTLHFPGKSGLIHDVRIENRKLAAVVRKCQHLPGQRLFQYLDDDGRQHAIDSGQINEYLRQHLGTDYSARDFRTWHATWRAYQLLLETPRPQPFTDRACREAVATVVKQVAAELRNTPAVCRKSYIHPVILSAWQAGKGPFRSQAAQPRHRSVADLSATRLSGHLHGLCLAALAALAGCQTAPVQTPPVAPIPVATTTTVEAPASPIQWNGQDRIDLALTLDRGRRPLAPARVMGRDTIALLDSGAGIPALSRALVADAGGGSLKVEVNGQQVDAVKNLPLELGAISMTLPLAILIDHNAERPFVVGSDLFLHAIVEMDFASGRLMLIRPEAFTPPAGEAVPVKLWNGVPTLQLQVNGNPRQVCTVIDTGFNGGLALAPEVVGELALPPDPAGGTRVAQDGFGNRYERPLLAPLEEMRFGQLLYNKVPVTYGIPLPDAGACGNVLGMAVLSRHRLVFDLGHERVWFLLR